MSPLGIAKYMIYAGFFIIFLVIGFRLLFMDSIALEEMRQQFKRRFPISRDKFNRYRRLIGWVSIFISVIALWIIISDLTVL